MNEIVKSEIFSEFHSGRQNCAVSVSSQKSNLVFLEDDMRLGTLEQRIITVLSMNGDLDIETLSQFLKARSHQVRYSLSRLIDSTVLRYRARLNLLGSGFTVVDLFFSPTQNHSKTSTTLSTLHPQIVLAEEVGGRSSHHIRIATQTLSDVQDTIQRIGTMCGGLRAEKNLAVHLTSSHFGLKRFNVASDCRGACAIECKPNQQSHDPLDIRVLEALSSSQCTSQREIARLLGLPASTVNSRIQSLLKCGTISRFEYEVDVRALGLHPYRILLSARCGNSGFGNALYRFCAVSPTTTSLTSTLGAWDFEIECVVANPGELSDFINGLNSHLGEFITGTEIVPLLRPLSQTAWPLNLPRSKTDTPHPTTVAHGRRAAA